MWLAMSLLWMGCTGFEICREYSAYQQWQVVHDEWKRRYAEWEKAPWIPAKEETKAPLGAGLVCRKRSR